MARYGIIHLMKRRSFLVTLLLVLVALLSMYTNSKDVSITTFAKGVKGISRFLSVHNDINDNAGRYFDTFDKNEVYRPFLHHKTKDAYNQYDAKDDTKYNGVTDSSLRREGSLQTDSRNHKNAAMEATSDSSFRSKQLPERQQVVFEKVHKAASSTFSTILLRFAVSRSLNVFLMQSRHILNESGTTIDPKELVQLPRGQHFDILCSHIVFDEKVISPYFPKSTAYVAIVREPFSQFRSAFVYYAQVHKAPDPMFAIRKDPYNPIGYFLRHPEQFSRTQARYTHTNNRMSVDLGFPVKNLEAAKRNSTKIEEFVEYVHKRFDLVLIAELFDESVILFRRYMNWSMKDVLYLKSNAIGNRVSSQYNKGNWVERKNFTEEDLGLFRKWAPIDFALYNSSLKVFKEKIGKEERFKEEVEVFKKIREEVADFCAKAIQNELPSGRYVVEKSEWTDRFEVTVGECMIMGMNIPSLSTFTRNVQTERIKPYL